MTGLARAAAGVRWYVRELLGETKYERYLERMRRERPGETPLPAREFWREQARSSERTAGARCC